MELHGPNTENCKICNTCHLSMPLQRFEKQTFKLASGDIGHAYRNKCKYCRLQEKKKKMGETDGYRRHYWGMSEEKRKEYIKKKSRQNSTKKNLLEYRKKWNRSDKGIFLRYVHECNRRGRAVRGIKMELEFDMFSKLINGNCQYCNKENCRGIDRVDSSKSYTDDNSVSCCIVCNQMKSNMSLDSFVDHLKNILKNMEK